MCIQNSSLCWPFMYTNFLLDLTPKSLYKSRHCFVDKICHIQKEIWFDALIEAILPWPILGQLCFPDCAGTILLDFLPKSSSSFKAFKRPLFKIFLLKQGPLEKWTEHSILFMSLWGGLKKHYISKTQCILIELGILHCNFYPMKTTRTGNSGVPAGYSFEHFIKLQLMNCSIHFSRCPCLKFGSPIRK